MNAENGSNLPEAFELFEKFIESTLSPEEQSRLDKLVAGNADVRRAYLEYMHQHACLHWNAIRVSEADHRDFVEFAGQPNVGLTGSDRSALPRVNAGNWMFRFAALAAGLALLVGSWSSFVADRSGAPADQTLVATIIETKGCTWGESSLPTVQDAKLTNGTIHLLTGLATLEFASGASVTLESPAEFELIDPMKCVLHAGTLVANVPDRAKGFKVETATAVLVDQGTSFGVVVDRQNEVTNVQVFDGIVDVRQRASQKEQRISTGDRSIIADSRFEILGPESDEVEAAESLSVDPFEGAIEITTADGNGREGTIMPLTPKSGIFKKRLIIKTSDIKQKFNSRAYVAFDLATLTGRTIKQAQFQLHVLPSTRGYASLVPDATFAVYGITNETLDDWQPDSLTWDNGPANAHGADVDLKDAELLGTFVIPQGEDNGFVTVDGDDLVSFLNEDQNGTVTLLIVRETSETHPRGLAHTFARKTTHGGIAPTLRMIAN